MLKDGITCTGAAWTHTRADGSVLASAAADKGSESVDEDEGEMRLEEKPSRLSSGSRRQRGGGGGGGVTGGNPDLLTIPGVGPRNLRKLVEKGIGGVAELKQLYKDKVFWVCVNYENG